ncbi:MAG TPA: hypothetical protein VHZ28_10485 [Terracidiphilus sp.]|jgi:hypothetical protein|nr:hypothetical protein [Terracidiphilus sp.]
MWFRALLVAGALTTAATAQTPIEIQPLNLTDASGTCQYAPNGREKVFFKNLSAGEAINGSAADPYSIHSKTNKYIGWFGIVRGIGATSSGGDVKLLVEHKFFDGSTDCRIMVVSQSGGGDFVADVKIDPTMFPPLALARIYGVVIGEKDGMPQVLAQYVRVWPWHTFTFTEFGPVDASNPRWTKIAHTGAGGKVYNPSPTEDYYRAMLGDPLEFGLNLKPEASPVGTGGATQISTNR